MRRHGGPGVLVVAVLLALAGCGGEKAAPGSTGAQSATATEPRDVPAPPAQTAPTAPSDPTPAPSDPTPAPADPAPAPSVPGVPPGVPSEANGQPADPDDLAVVRRWLAALTRGDLAAAAEAFADGAVVVNATPPLRLRNQRERLAFNQTFPCGAEVAKASSSKGYVLVTYRLTDRTGSRCDGPGGTAFGAIKVKDGRMTEWYRLADPPQAPTEGAGPVV